MSENVPVLENLADLEILTCLLSRRTVAGAAECAGVSTRTIQRRLADPTFKAALDSYRKRALEETASNPARLALLSTQVLWDALESEKVGTKDKLRACSVILTTAIRMKEIEIERRLEALERAIGGE